MNSYICSSVFIYLLLEKERNTNSVTYARGKSKLLIKGAKYKYKNQINGFYVKMQSQVQQERNLLKE